MDGRGTRFSTISPQAVSARWRLRPRIPTSFMQPAGKACGGPISRLEMEFINLRMLAAPGNISACEMDSRLVRSSSILTTRIGCLRQCLDILMDQMPSVACFVQSMAESPGRRSCTKTKTQGPLRSHSIPKMLVFCMRICGHHVGHPGRPVVRTRERAVGCTSPQMGEPYGGNSRMDCRRGRTIWEESALQLLPAIRTGFMRMSMRLSGVGCTVQMMPAKVGSL